MKIVIDGMEASGLESGIAIFNATDVREKQAYLIIEDEHFEFDADSGLQYRVSGRFHVISNRIPVTHADMEALK